MTDSPAFRPPVFEQPNFRADAQGELDDYEGDDDEVDDVDDTDETDDIDEAAPAGVNQVSGGTARAVLDHIARSLVDDPDAVQIEVSEARQGVKLSLHVAPSDMGRVIGRRGRVAQAIRSLVRAAAARDGTDASVDIVD
jgi:uncharacterized protein